VSGDAELRVLVVEDERPARDELAFQLSRVEEVGEVLDAADATECLRLLESADVDAVFLDVRMPGLDGLELARVVRLLARPPRIVFVTAFDSYAVEAFGLAAVDYLLKPVRPERLRATVKRLVEAGRAEAATGGAGHGGGADDGVGDRLPVLARGRFVLVNVADIRVAVVAGERVTVHTAEGRFQARHTLAELELRLHGRGFLRVHRAYLVNLRHVTTIEGFFNGTYLLRLRDVTDLAVPVSRRHAADLRAAVRL
jgi:two-component system, LytTR family, response regulator